MRITTFLKSESAAVTVDWVVLTGSVVGLGIATMAVVSGGVENLSTDVATGLADQSPNGNFNWGQSADPTQTSMDFTGGSAGGWSGGTVMSPIAALGEMLVLDSGEEALLQMSFPEGTDTATFTFDLIGGDSLDNEVASITANGTLVASARGRYTGTMEFTDAGAPGVTIETETLSSGTNLGGAADQGWRESVTRVTVTVDNPDTDMTFGVRSGADQQISDEFFAIDNVEVTSQ